MSTYEAAGVSLATADALRLAVARGRRVDGRERLRRVRRSPPARRQAPARRVEPTTVGTKLILARERGALRNCGADLAAHCINDVITCGAEPLMLLDYVAANRIDLEQVAELVDGAAEVCRAAGCALVGGETAELPGVYREEELDFAGTCVGVVERGSAARRLEGRSRRRRSSACRPPACTRTASRSSGAFSKRRTTTATTCSRRRGSTSTTCGACARGRTRSRT